ncbi:cysteine hydrolase family protein [Bradyrhizobium canariense]|uniref:Nicotinamidase-related amidase n=1 Tax=Bradyrhizobium canariense TaxID=255045 RepID=A0A1H1WES3_9BRAD|nr:isochorismatase family protein [Bradyrhizobium canariense]SDS95757.1 Nicotinamidase-related amidase [Bradyrhizobium canariense]
MTISMLDANTALLVIDLQKGIVGLPTVHPMADIVQKAVGLTATFRKHDLPVVLINVDGGPPGRTEQSLSTRAFPPGWADLIPELNQQPSDHLVTKRTRGAFTHTDLDKYLRQRNITQVVIAGVATGSGVESTARHAHELGFNVALAIDAMTDMDADIHHNSVARIFPKLGETGTTQQIIDLLDAPSRSEKGNA